MAQVVVVVAVEEVPAGQIEDARAQKEVAVVKASSAWKLAFAELVVAPCAFDAFRRAPFESCKSFRPKGDNTRSANQPFCTCHSRLSEHRPPSCASAYPTLPVDQGLER